MYIVADNILSPLGMSSSDCLDAMERGGSSLSLHRNGDLLPDPFIASKFSDADMRAMMRDGMSAFESVACSSIETALSGTGIDVSSDRVALILSTTKGDIGLLRTAEDDAEGVYPGASALRIARRLGFTTTPVTVCNACISGVAAMILADRLLSARAFDYAVVCGCDMLSRFTLSGFASLKVLSSSPCRPFDIERSGLNLGEAAATVVFSSVRTSSRQWALERGAIRNDAFHITTAATDGRGLRLAIGQVTEDCDAGGIGMVNAHATATLYNDRMESAAIQHTALAGVPVNALKGYIGHTMGAAGVVETVVSMHAMDRGLILGTRGFGELGVSGRLDVSPENRTTACRSFVKTMSGFGGCNAAVRLREVMEEETQAPATAGPRHLTAVHTVRVTPTGVEADSRPISFSGRGIEMLNGIYRDRITDYPRYFKMDRLCRLAFIASELLLQCEGRPRREMASDRAIVVFNRSASVASDREYLHSIGDGDGFFPNPAVFVYTLPNILTGEIAIRNGYLGETSLYVLPEKDDSIIGAIIDSTTLDSGTRSVIGGWVDYESDDSFLAEMGIYE